MHVLEQVVASSGAASSGWAGPEPETLEAWSAASSNIVSAVGDETWVGLELPFQSQTSLLQAMDSSRR